MADNRFIGIYDSGLGGLSVWKEVKRILPEESLLYLGDGKNCPYGSRSKEEVRTLADEAIKYLVENDCKLIIVACNTATAAAIDFLRQKYTHLPIVGMEPAVKPACLRTKTKVVGVLATERSLDGDLFRHTAKKYATDIEVITAAGRGFVEVVEQNEEDSPKAEALVRAATEEMLAKGADEIVLGCTHYPFLKPVLEKITAGMKVEILDPAPAVARHTLHLLNQGQMRSEKGHSPQYLFRTFADEEYAQKLASKAQSIKW